ncbi:MAG TPA: VCBS repeat-containing protein [Myxococcota bacterium]|nr:VCBS repeat-containing protein [Myxococcota bacterium]HRY94370.1 VCBS repeat-containing protein [Myxococcota bacterium]HSA22923.1 VCBS repeat-containing protein [Myxococcota bacterium]
MDAEHLVRLLLAAALCALAGCSDPDPGQPCAIDADCPFPQVCEAGRCQAGDGGGDDGGQTDGGLLEDHGPRPDREDLGSWDAGALTPCAVQGDCAAGERCHQGLCVTVEPPPDCAEGEDDRCEDDAYCEPSLHGCVSWDAHGEPAPTCEYIPPEGQFTPREEWVWEHPLEAPEWDEVMMTPVVVALDPSVPDTDYPGPAVIFNSFRADLGYSQEGVLRAVRGDTGAPLWSVTDPAHRTHPVSNIAAADLDGDGRPEIVTGKSGGRDLLCFRADGTFLWETTTDSLSVGWGGPAIADLEGDGVPEVVIGAAVVDADGAVRWQRSGSRGDNFRQFASAPFSVPADVVGDARLEIVTGDTLYDADGNELWNTHYGDGFVAVANLIGGDTPEIVVVARGSVRVQSSATGEIVWLREAAFLSELPECEPDCGLLGPPTVADFDGDGLPEIGVAGAGIYLVLDTFGDVLWHIASRDSSSNITGSAVFDFEGDRRAEVVYADEIALRVLRGRDGTVLYQQPHSSLTACEYPVIADVDGDHNAEIVIAQNDLMADAPQKFKGVRVFGDAQDNWVTTRPIWNQHAYHVTNVEADGGVPAVAAKNWLTEGLNNFRQNVQTSGLFDAPDLTLRGLGFAAGNCQADGVVVYVEVQNRGLQAVAAGVPVAFYLGDPRQGGQFLGVEVTRHALGPGQAEVVAFLVWGLPLRQVFTVFAVVDDQGGGAVPSGQTSECREQNNLGRVDDVVCLPET